MFYLACFLVLISLYAFYKAFMQGFPWRMVLPWATVVALVLGAVLSMGCGGPTPNPTPTTSTSTPTTVVDVETYTRDDGRAPGMDVIVTVKDATVGVDSVTITYKVGTKVTYLHLCCNWYRLEDMYGVTWAGNPEGDTLTLSPPTPNLVLTKGTWVVHMYLANDMVPTMESVSFTERKINK
jgi:hypothetical protein